MAQHGIAARDSGAAHGADPSLPARWRRLRRIPSGTRTVGTVLLGCAAAPPAVLLAASGEPPADRLWVQPLFVNLIACGVGIAAVLGLERPRSASPLAYARQLRARFLAIQSTFDADDRRRPGEGKEKEDDRVPTEP